MIDLAWIIHGPPPTTALSCLRGIAREHVIARPEGLKQSWGMLRFALKDKISIKPMTIF